MTTRLENLQNLFDDYQTKFKTYSKLHWKLMCRFGVFSDSKLKKLPACDIIGSKLDNQVQEAKKDMNESRTIFIVALNSERSYWISGYWYWFHSWNREQANKWAKGKVSDIRSMINNHTNLNAVMNIMGGNVNAAPNRYYTVRHFRNKGFECDCDYCALNVHLGNKLYERFYRGNPKNNPCDFLAIKGE